MDTNTLSELMSKDIEINKYFKGVYPRDFLPYPLEKKSLYCINLSKSTDRDNGSHWVLISSVFPDYTAYVCSLGNPPVHDDVIDKLFSLNLPVVYNNFRNQGVISTVCGWHVVFTAAMISRGHNLLDIMTKFFTNSPYINDRCVVEILSCAHNIDQLVPISDWGFIFDKKRLPKNLKDFMADGFGEVHSEQYKLNEKFSKMDVETTGPSKPSKRKQKDPKKKTDTAKRGSKTQKEKDATKRGSNQVVKQQKTKERKEANDQVIKPSQAKNTAQAISAKAELIEDVNQYKKTVKNFNSILENFGKRLDVFTSKENVKLIRFLLYLIIKEKRECQKKRFTRACHCCGHS